MNHHIHFSNFLNLVDTVNFDGFKMKTNLFLADASVYIYIKDDMNKLAYQVFLHTMCRVSDINVMNNFCFSFRYYKGRILDMKTLLFYKVVFDDKSFCFDLPPGDIQVCSTRLLIFKEAIGQVPPNLKKATSL